MELRSISVQKNSTNSAVDYLKFIFVFCIVSIHLPLFESVNKDLSFWFNQVVCRLAVPFFFLCSGFFAAGKTEDRLKFSAYLKRLVILYLFYTALFLPQIVYLAMQSDRSFGAEVLEFIRDFFLVGSYGPLWFYPALIGAMVLLWLLTSVCKLRRGALLAVASVLYALGVCGNTYQAFFLGLPGVGSVLNGYLTVFETTRNGLFFGLFFLSVGYCLRKPARSVPKKVSLPLFVLGFLLMFLEKAAAVHFVETTENDMLFTLPLAVIPLFLFVCAMPGTEKQQRVGVYLRKLTTVVFGIHTFIMFYLSFALKCLHLTVNGTVRYFLVSILSVLFGVCVLQLSKRYKFFKLFC